ncbi:MAG: hypothetical protein LBI61_01575 [Puniceicoccales bacterium]|jgi:tetratricopeptide (TPR) repeat protein|nr:hypothetical protein [Puniceicoccales bacterium]
MDEEEKKSQDKYHEALREAADHIISGDFSLKEYYGLGDEGLEAIYVIGYEMYKHKQYAKAKGVFSILTMLDPTPRYLSACGSAHFMAGDYANAVQYFRMALLGGDYTPKTLLRLVECTIRMSQFELAKKYVDEIVSLAHDDKFKNDKESMTYEARAKMIGAALSKQLAQSAK